MLVSTHLPGSAHLHHDLARADDDRSGGRGLQLYHAVHRLRADQPAPRALHRGTRPRSSHPVAVRSGSRAVGGNPFRRVAVDLTHVPDLPVRLLLAAQAAHQRGARHGGNALADLLASRAPAAQTRDRHRRGDPVDGGAEDLRSGRAAHERRPGHLDPVRRLLPVGAGLGVQQVQLRRGRLDHAAVHLLGAHLWRHLPAVRQSAPIARGALAMAVSRRGPRAGREAQAHATSGAAAGGSAAPRAS